MQLHSLHQSEVTYWLTWTGLSAVNTHSIGGVYKTEKVHHRTIERGKISDNFIILTENYFILRGRLRKLLNTSECSSR